MTIYSLAKKLNMTPSMVSRALNPDGKISAEKRQIVLEAAEKYQFQPNKFASRLSMKPIRIGVLICSRFQVNTDKMIEGIQASYRQLRDYKIEHDISVLAPDAPESEIRAVFDRYRNYSGIILSGMSAPPYTEIISALYRKNPNVVQVQAVNEAAPSLFSSKHDEATASGIAADFLSHCLKRSPRKNVLLFTGDLASTVHANAAKAFGKFCNEKGLSLLSVVDMKDDVKYFESILPRVFAEHEADLDGIYITSGLSSPLLRYVEGRALDLPLVAFDTHSEIKHYMERGIVSAAISQNVTNQMRVAFDLLARHIITAESCPDTVYTDVHLMLKESMSQFD